MGLQIGGNQNKGKQPAKTEKQAKHNNDDN